MASIPLFLEGKTFLVWDELSNDEKKDAGRVKSALEAVFSLTHVQAYKCFTKRNLRMDESVDSYAADLKRLLCFQATPLLLMGKTASWLNSLSLDFHETSPER